MRLLIEFVIYMKFGGMEVSVVHTVRRKESKRHIAMNNQLDNMDTIFVQTLYTVCTSTTCKGKILFLE